MSAYLNGRNVMSDYVQTNNSNLINYHHQPGLVLVFWLYHPSHSFLDLDQSHIMIHVLLSLTKVLKGLNEYKTLWQSQQRLRNV